MRESDGVVMVLNANGEPAGMGVLVSHRYVVTCGHVVSLALGKGSTCQASKKEKKIRLSFPFGDGDRQNGENYEVEVVEWIAPAEVTVEQTSRQDFALLRIENPPTSPCRFARTEKTAEVKVYGFPAFTNPKGSWGIGRYSGPVGDGLSEIRCPDPQFAMDEGHSGGAVYCETKEASLGMVVLVKGDLAYFVPTNGIDEQLKAWQVDRLTLPIIVPRFIYFHLAAIIFTCLTLLVLTVGRWANDLAVIAGSILLALVSFISFLIALWWATRSSDDS